MITKFLFLKMFQTKIYFNLKEYIKYKYFETEHNNLCADNPT
jgi:hypothetical protein